MPYRISANEEQLIRDAGGEERKIRIFHRMVDILQADVNERTLDAVFNPDRVDPDVVYRGAFVKEPGVEAMSMAHSSAAAGGDNQVFLRAIQELLTAGPDPEGLAVLSQEYLTYPVISIEVREQPPSAIYGRSGGIHMAGDIDGFLYFPGPRITIEKTGS